MIPAQPTSYNPFLADGGEMGHLIRKMDWTKTPIGPPETWPLTLRTAVNIMLDTRFPMAIAWGPAFTMLYNDGYRPMIGLKHPQAMGASAQYILAEIWDSIGPLFNQVMTGQAVVFDDFLAPLYRNGFLEECYFDFSYSPIRLEDGQTGGVLVTISETTDRVIRERRSQTLRDVAAYVAHVKTDQQISEMLRHTLAHNAKDVPFALLYQVQKNSQEVRLIDSVRAESYAIDAPAVIDLTQAASTQWAGLAHALHTRQPQRLTSLSNNADTLLTRNEPSKDWPEMVCEAYVLPVYQPGRDQAYGLLIVGVNPHQAYDGDYQLFFESLANYIVTAFSNAAVLEEERAQAQAQLEVERTKFMIQTEANKQLRLLFEQAPVAICILRGPEFIVELANERQYQIWDREASQMIGNPLFKVINESRQLGIEELLQNVLQTGQPATVTDQMTTLFRRGTLETAYFSASYQPIHDSDGRVNSVLVVTNEVTQSVVARQKLEESEARFRTVADTAPVMIWMSGLDKLCTFFNNSWLAFTGRTMEQEYGNGWTAGVHEDDLKRCLTTYTTSFDARQPFYMEYRLRRHDGEYRWIADSATPRFTANGHFEGYIGGCIDIHENKTLNEALEARVNERTEALRKANYNLERSNFDLMQFASVASHDLKEPLRKIQAFGNILQTTAADKLDDVELDYFNRMINASGRMQDLVDDVLNLSKLSYQSLIYTDTDLSDVIRRITDDLEINILEKGGKVQVGELPTIEANTGQIHQLFQNLISNALKFSAGATPLVHIEQAPVSESESNRFHIKASDYVSIHVRDNGIGFDETYREKIFGLFQRLHGARYGGTGIGLAICKKIVDNHHGFIYADGIPNQGATFTVILPLKQD
ncbi:PAS domain S-box protein [Spirosoma soli]|uniref:histidine kinase n=1 Tax=Spirosoma soli TaxID=1770529 RepID=A0ABW5LWY6_9BACT